jgi:hypothetical protein
MQQGTKKETEQDTMMQLITSPKIFGSTVFVWKAIRGKKQQRNQRASREPWRMCHALPAIRLVGTALFIGRAEFSEMI